MQVEIWSDVVCPWCYIGKRRFEAALDRFRAEHPDVEVDVRFRAFMLDPSAPTDRSEPARDVYERKFGGPDAATAVFQRVTDAAAGEGLEFRLDRAVRANTLAAHRLLVLGDQLGCQAELKERLMAAYFSEGRDLGDVEVLVEVASAVGIDADRARQWLATGQGRDEVADHLTFAAEQGLTSVPTYVVDRRVAIPGAQDPEVFLRLLVSQLDRGDEVDPSVG